MRLRIDRTYALDLDPDATFGETLAQLAAVHPDVPSSPPSGTSVVLWRDDDHWVQLEAPPARILREWLLLNLHQVNELAVVVSERCMHSSPAIPGGYACGRC